MSTVPSVQHGFLGEPSTAQLQVQKPVPEEFRGGLDAAQDGYVRDQRCNLWLAAEAQCSTISVVKMLYGLNY